MLDPDDREIISAPRPGAKVCILGDTQDPSASVELARDADLLVHEATNWHGPDRGGEGEGMSPQQFEAHVAKRGHSTPVRAGRFAKLVGAKHLALNHLSPRYDNHVPPGFARSAEWAMGMEGQSAVTVAKDFLVIGVGVLSGKEGKS